MQIQCSLYLLRDPGHSSEVPPEKPDSGDETRGARAIQFQVEEPLNVVPGHTQFFACDSVSRGFNLQVTQLLIQSPKGEKKKKKKPAS